MVSKFPNRALALFNYMHIIRNASFKVRGLAWYAYDIKFRKRVAKNPGVNWGQRDMQLYLDKFTGLAQDSCFSCGSADHLAEDCPLSVPSKQVSSKPDTTSTKAPSVPAHLAPSSIVVAETIAANPTPAHPRQPTPFCRAALSPSTP